MIKLLNAGFFKLKKSKIFWAMIIATFLIAGVRLIFEINSSDILSDNLDMILSSNLSIMAFVISLFIILFTGNEYSERSD